MNHSKVGREDFILAYYIEELRVAEIAARFGVREETVRRQYERFHLPLRDRPWPEEQVLDDARTMVEHCDGLSLEMDMRTMARRLLRRRSDVVRALSGPWLRIFAPNVDIEVSCDSLRCMNRAEKYPEGD